jgi:hypothetical protein
MVDRIENGSPTSFQHVSLQCSICSFVTHRTTQQSNVRDPGKEKLTQHIAPVLPWRWRDTSSWQRPNSDPYNINTKWLTMNLKLPGTSHGRFSGRRMAIFDIWKVSLDGTPNFFKHTWTSLAIIFVASKLFLCLFWTSYGLKIGVYNTLASKICVKLLKPPNIQITTPNTSFRIRQHIHDFTPCSLHSQVTNPLILSWIGVSTLGAQVRKNWHNI